MELPTNPHVVLVLYKDGNEVWRISVRPGVPVLSLYLFCVLGERKGLMSQMNHSLSNERGRG